MLIRKSTEVSIFCLCLGGIPFDRNFQVCFFCVRFQDKAVVIAKRKKSLKFLKLQLYQYECAEIDVLIFLGENCLLNMYELTKEFFHNYLVT